MFNKRRATMFHVNRLATSIGTMVFFFIILWTLHTDIRLLNAVNIDVKQRTSLQLSTKSGLPAARALDLQTISNNLSPRDWNDLIHNNTTEQMTTNALSSFTVVLNTSDLLEQKYRKDKETSTSYWYLFQKSFNKKEILNPFLFNYTLHPGNICSENDVFLLIYVHSAPDHYKRRMIIRNTWGNPFNIPLLKLRVLFFIGATNTSLIPTLQEALKFEHERYGDIVQANYIDSYRNLTLKGISALKYISENCAAIPYILKTDDDIFVNVFSLARHLNGITADQNKRTSKQESNKTPGLFLSCLVWYRMRVVRDQDSKWFVSKHIWNEEYFPPYCSGAAYIFSGRTAQALFNASLYTPFFWIDDLYITGILAIRLGIKHRKLTSAYQLDFKRFYELYQDNPEDGMPLIFSHIDNFNKVGNLWNLIASRRRGVPLGSTFNEHQTIFKRKRKSLISLPQEYTDSFTMT